MNGLATYEDVVAQTKQPLLGVVPDLSEFDLNEEDFWLIWDVMTDAEKREFDVLLRTAPPRSLMAHQIVPWEQLWWEIFMLIGGRGVGKTVTGAFAVREHLHALGKKARVGIGAPTNADARDVCAEGETGLLTMFPHEFTKYNRSLGEAHHVKGGYVKFQGTEKPSKWNGPQWSLLWFDELSLCNEKSVNDALLGLRLGPAFGPYRARMIATLTPKNKKWVKSLAQSFQTCVAQYIDRETGKLRLPTTYDNPYLPKARVDWLTDKFGNTRIGRQELKGEFIDDVPGALWNRDMFQYADVEKLPRFTRIVVAVDPAGSVARKEADKNALTDEQRQNQQKNADTGIAVVAYGVDRKYYVLNVISGQWTPEEWASKAIEFYHMYRADKIVAEKNYGGAMVEHTIRTIDGYSKRLQRQLTGRHIPIKLVSASKGKHIRANPVVALYEQRKVYHAFSFGPAEDQMCSFVDVDENEGADMVDATVWCFAEIIGLGDNESSIIVTPGEAMLQDFIVM